MYKKINSLLKLDLFFKSNLHGKSLDQVVNLVCITWKHRIDSHFTESKIVEVLGIFTET